MSEVTAKRLAKAQRAWKKITSPTVTVGFDHQAWEREALAARDELMEATKADLEARLEEARARTPT